MSDAPAATRCFSWADQEQFAGLSSDRNPMHMDPVFARRTQPGAPVVHGIHVLLWALECWGASGADLTRLTQIRVRFTKFVYVDKPVELRVLANGPEQTKLSVVGDDLTLLTISLQHGERSGAAELAGAHAARSEVAEAPARPSLAEMRTLEGWLTPPCSNDDVRRHFPVLADTFGAPRIAALMQLSTLVGMACPGLHSIFSGLQLSLVEDNSGPPGLGWRTSRVDERYRLVTLRVAGSGIEGEVSAFVRREPSAVVRVAELSQSVGADEFQGIRALIIGGSRGLGAACAKLLSAGGAQVVVTYLNGRGDALDVMDDIVATRGEGACEVLHFDVNGSVAEQLDAVDGFDQLYYFATSQIFRQKPEGYSPALFGEFVRVYVDGFHAVVRAVQQRAPGRRLAVFYPSSVAVDEQPRGMTEYAMAKAAGETLCSILARDDPALRCVVHRIPRTATDQTATVAPTEEANPLDVMLPLIRRMKLVSLDAVRPQ